jgi:hypothetical protein
MPLVIRDRGFRGQMQSRYTDALKRYQPTIAENVTSNLSNRHLKPIFIG